MLLPLFSSKDHAPLPSLVAEALHSDRLVSAGEHAELRRREHERLARRAAHRAHEAQLNRPEPDEDNYEEDEE